ncbi:MAG: hypothetical protein EXR07_06460 [Acetobacteraceae bacterium]|nr:hypothetical protein [Acetobacteraceae bacterium]
MTGPSRRAHDHGFAVRPRSRSGSRAARARRAARRAQVRQARARRPAALQSLSEVAKPAPTA